MPFPIAAAIAAGATIASGVASTAMTNRANRKAWERQNAYNDPRMQMARLQNAGLNPHLVYGGGTQGATGMSSSAQDVEPTRLPTDFSEQLSQHVTRRRMEAEIPNIQKQQQVMDADIALKASQQAQNMATTARTRFDLQQADRLKDISAESALQNLANLRSSGRKTVAETGNIPIQGMLMKSNIKLNEQSVRESSQRIKESADRIKTGVQNRSIGEIEKQIKTIELELRKLGINPNDPAWSRILGRILDETGATDGLIRGAKEIPSTLKNLWDWIR